MYGPANTPSIDDLAAYQITVLGSLSLRWSERLEGMTILTTSLNDGVTLSILSGILTDQAALIGVLNTLYEFHLPLLTVIRLPIAGMK